MIDVQYFDIDASIETALSLQEKTQPVLLHLFKQVFDTACREGKLCATPQGAGKTITRKRILAQRFISLDDPPEVAERKIRAFWYPPNPPAEIRIGEHYFPIISQEAFLNERAGGTLLGRLFSLRIEFSADTFFRMSESV